MAVVKVHNTEYHIDTKLKEKWDKIKDGKLKKEDDDRVFIVDGRERSGKSVFAFQQACYIDPTLVGDLSRICFTAEEFLTAIRKTNSTDEITKCIIFDEAFRGLASRAAMSTVNKKIIQALMEVGQKNLVLFIILPSFFMLDLYPAMLRSNALFHIKKDLGTKRRSFSVYSRKKKAKLYQTGVRKGWSYNLPTRFNGRFPKTFPGGEEFDKKYREKKHRALVISEKEEFKKEFSDKHLMQRDKMLDIFMKKFDLSLRQASDILKEGGLAMSHTQIRDIRKKVASEVEKSYNKARFLSENAEKVEETAV